MCQRLLILLISLLILGSRSHHRLLIGASWGRFRCGLRGGCHGGRLFDGRLGGGLGRMGEWVVEVFLISHESLVYELH